MQKTLRFQEPPPSLNRAWRTYRGRTPTRSEEFKSWERTALIEIAQQSAGFQLPEFCYYSTRIFVPRSKTRADLDNLPKAIHDALKKSGITPDDRYLVKMNIEFWAGDYLIVHINKERLSLWIKIMRPSRSLMKKLERLLPLTRKV